MDIDDLTYGQIKQLRTLFGESATREAPFRERWVLIRSNMSGVWFAKLVAKRGLEIDLVSARRFYSWTGALTVATIAATGAAIDSQLCAPVACTLSQWEELIDASESAIAVLSAIPIAK